MFRIFFCQFNTFLPNFYIGRWKVAPHVHQATMLAPSAQIKTRKCITPYRTNGRHSQQEISLNNFSFQHVLFTEVYLQPYQTCLSGFYCKCVSVFCFCFCFSFFSFSANETVYSRFGLLYSVRLVSYQTSFSTMLWRNQGQKRSFADVLQNRYSLKFGKFHSKTPLLESLFNKSCRPGFFEDFWLY